MGRDRYINRNKNIKNTNYEIKKSKEQYISSKNNFNISTKEHLSNFRNTNNDFKINRDKSLNNIKSFNIKKSLINKEQNKLKLEKEKNDENLKKLEEYNKYRENILKDEQKQKENNERIQENQRKYDENLKLENQKQDLIQKEYEIRKLENLNNSNIHNNYSNLNIQGVTTFRNSIDNKNEIENLGNMRGSETNFSRSFLKDENLISSRIENLKEKSERYKRVKGLNNKRYKLNNYRYNLGNDNSLKNRQKKIYQNEYKENIKQSSENQNYKNYHNYYSSQYNKNKKIIKEEIYDPLSKDLDNDGVIDRYDADFRDSKVQTIADLDKRDNIFKNEYKRRDFRDSNTKYSKNKKYYKSKLEDDKKYSNKLENIKKPQDDNINIKNKINVENGIMLLSRQLDKQNKDDNLAVNSITEGMYSSSKAIKTIKAIKKYNGIKNNKFKNTNLNNKKIKENIKKSKLKFEEDKKINFSKKKNENLQVFKETKIKDRKLNIKEPILKSTSMYFVEKLDKSNDENFAVNSITRPIIKANNTRNTINRVQNIRNLFNKKNIKKIIQKKKNRELMLDIAKEQNRYLSSIRNVSNKLTSRIKSFIPNLVKKVATTSSLKFLIVPILIFILIIILLGSCTNFLIIGTSSIMQISYKAPIKDITQTDNYMNKLEMDLKYEIENLETIYPGYDEYIVENEDWIGHDPQDLAAYLTVLYEDFTYPEIEEKVKELFKELYDYKLVAKKEIRYRTKIIRGETIQEPYEYVKLIANLKSKTIDDLVNEKFNKVQKEYYEILKESKGNFSFYNSPIIGNWKQNIEKVYGWQINKDGQKENYKGIDINVNGKFVAIAAGRVTSIGSNYIVIKDNSSKNRKYTITYRGNISFKVKNGEYIKINQELGVVSGSLTIEIQDEKGRYINPYYHMFSDDFYVANSGDGYVSGDIKNIGAKINNGKKLAWPVPGHSRISSPFGMRIHPVTKVRSFHSGVDIPAPKGKPIISVLDGKVIESRNAGTYGNMILIEHSNGVRTRYAHCSKLNVRVGQIVKAGDVIGLIGSTGRSTGPHLHFEVIINGKPVNPLNYI